MQQGREVKENNSAQSGRKYDSFGGLGFGVQMFPSIFGGKDPFDDPFFTRQHSSRSSKGPVIEEMDGDDDRFSEENDGNKNNPIVEHPEDQGFDNGKKNSESRALAHRSNHTSKIEGAQSRTRSESFKRVTYGGVNGTYYSATISRRTGDDGVTLEESKQADKTTGQATHRISRGIHDKGHSVTRKLDSDGKVDMKQTLHNLNEDELAGFEQAWKGNAGGQLHSQEDRFDFSGNTGVHGRLAGWGGFADPFREHFHHGNRGQSSDNNFQPRSTGGRAKKIVTINIE